MADLSITGSTTGIDISKWRKLTPQEIIKEESSGQEIPPEIVSWAQQMAAFAKIPDNVTYEDVDGDVGLEALDKLGITPEEAGLAQPQAENALASGQTEEPDAIQDPARAQESGEKTSQDENIFAAPGYAAEAGAGVTETQEEVEQEEQLTLADSALTTDPEEIRKRKARRGLE